MREIRVISDGDWSDPKIWSENRLPGRGDAAVNIGHIVKIDIDLVGKYVPSLLVAADEETQKAGQFVIEGSRQIGDTRNGVCINTRITSPWPTPCISFHGSERDSLLIFGEIFQGLSDSYSLVIIRNNSRGKITYFGDITTGSAHSIYNVSGIVNVIGSVWGGRDSKACGIYNESGLVFIKGAVTGGIADKANAVFNIDGKVSVVGSVTGGKGFDACGIRSLEGDVFACGRVMGGSGDYACGIYHDGRDPKSIVQVIGCSVGGLGTRAHGVYVNDLCRVKIVGFTENSSDAFGVYASNLSNVTVVGGYFPGIPCILSPTRHS